jgi:hypothetical protein
MAFVAMLVRAARRRLRAGRSTRSRASKCKPKTWAYANEFIVPRMMVITKLDGHADFGTALKALRTVSAAIILSLLPIGRERLRGVVDVVHLKAYGSPTPGEIEIRQRNASWSIRPRRLIELVAESDDALMEK